MRRHAVQVLLGMYLAFVWAHGVAWAAPGRAVSQEGADPLATLLPLALVVAAAAWCAAREVAPRPAARRVRLEAQQETKRRRKD